MSDNSSFDGCNQLPIRACSGGEATPNKVVLNVTDTLEESNFAYASEPAGWNAEEIASYLTLNVTPGQLGQLSAMEQKDAVNKMLSERALAYFETQVAKRARGFVNLDYLAFESSLFDSSRHARVTVGKYVGRNLYVSYTQNLIGEMTPSFRVEYYVNRRNEIIAEGTAKATPDDQYRTSLRYQFRLRY